MRQSVFLAYFISCLATALHSHVFCPRYATPMSFSPPLDTSESLVVEIPPLALAGDHGYHTSRVLRHQSSGSLHSVTDSLPGL